MSKRITKDMVTVDFLRVRFNYDPDTGVVSYSGRERARLPPSQQSRRAGKPVGWKDSKGHMMVKIGKTDYMLHRVVWAMQTGSWPVCSIDHINGVRDDNRWENLREASHVINMQNRSGAATGSESKELGVSRSATPGKWMANIKAGGVPMRLGTYKSETQAFSAYLNAKIIVHPEAPIVQGLTFDPALLTETAKRNLLRAGFTW